MSRERLFSVAVALRNSPPGVKRNEKAKIQKKNFKIEQLRDCPGSYRPIGLSKERQMKILNDPLNDWNRRMRTGK